MSAAGTCRRRQSAAASRTALSRSRRCRCGGCAAPSLSFNECCWHLQAEAVGGGEPKRPVAIKALSLRGLRGNWKALDLFQREAKTLEALQHPGIPRYLDYFEEDAAQDKGFFLVQVRNLEREWECSKLVSEG